MRPAHQALCTNKSKKWKIEILLCSEPKSPLFILLSVASKSRSDFTGEETGSSPLLPRAVGGMVLLLDRAFLAGAACDCGCRQKALHRTRKRRRGLGAPSPGVTSSSGRHNSTEIAPSRLGGNSHLITSARDFFSFFSFHDGTNQQMAAFENESPARPPLRFSSEHQHTDHYPIRSNWRYRESRWGSYVRVGSAPADIGPTCPAAVKRSALLQ